MLEAATTANLFMTPLIETPRFWKIAAALLLAPNYSFGQTMHAANHATLAALYYIDSLKLDKL